MKVLIAYCSRYGTAHQCATDIAKRITAEVDVVDLADTRDIDLSPYGMVVIGGSVYAGKIERRILSFCESHRTQLSQKDLAVYLCCLYQGERALQQLHEAYPDWMLAHAFHAALPGGELRYAELRWRDKMAVRGVARPGEDVRLLKPEALQALAAAANGRVKTS
jgi:menaquinone-dependent protoporphyrinogen oxidase